MKKRFTVIYAIFASLFMLFSLGFCGYNLYTEYKQGDSRTSSIFANTVFRLYTDLQQLNDKQANNNQKIIHAAGDLSDYSYYEIKRGNEVLFTYPLGTTQEATSSHFTKRYTSEIQIENKGNFTVDCNIFLLRPYAIYHYSNIAFFMILGVTLLTVILIIVSNKQEKNAEEEEDDGESHFEDLPDEKIVVVNEAQEDANKKKEEEVTESAKEEIKEELADSDIEVTYDRTEENDDTIIEIKPANEEVTTADKTVVENKEIEPIKEEKKTGKTEPEGLFSTSSGLGWESYLLTRLENEISRAISSEMDISIFVIKLTNLERSSDLSIQVCNYLADQFKFRDLLFEYKEDCIVAIENGADLDSALSLADKLHDDIKKILDGTESKCYMGISTRSIRMISAQRFLKEADEALVHAQEDETSPIIAFRADVEKYRKYMEQNYQD